MKRLLSCYSNCFGASGVWVAAERLRDTGFQNLELALRGHNFGGLIIPESVVVTEKAGDDEARRFVDHLKSHGVGVSGCNVGGANILTEEGLELTRRRIEFSKKWFDVRVVVSGAGQPSTPEERRTMVRSLRSLGDTAAALGVVIALETHKGPTQNAEAMLALMADVEHPAVLLNFDTGNIAYYNESVDPVEELKKVKHLVRNVHLKDNRGGFEDWYFPAVGDGGAVDFRKILGIMDDVGYTGAYTVEIEGIKDESEPGLDRRVERLKRSYDHLVACGYAD